MQRDLAEQDGEQDVTIEVLEPAPQATDLVACEHERHRLDRAARGRRLLMVSGMRGRIRIRMFRVRCWAHWTVVARLTLFIDYGNSRRFLENY
jgi:hypothetical protein